MLFSKGIPTDILVLRLQMQWDTQVLRPNPLDLTTRVIFSDGSCFFPKDRQFSLAGAAIIQVEHGQETYQNLRRQMLPGADHTPHRAEIFGIILALQTGHVVEIWCDCASVIGDLKNMLFYLRNGTSWVPPDHSELWEIVFDLIKERPFQIACHKTKGHVVITPELSEQQHWEAVLNTAVDNQAKEPIVVDNSTLFQTIQTAFSSHTAQREIHQKVVECQSKITQTTCQLLKKPVGHNTNVQAEEVPENPPPNTTMLWNVAYNKDDCNRCMYNPVFMYRVCEWANTLSWENHATGETSFLELFLEFSFTTKTLAPCDTIKPPYYLLFDYHPTHDSSGFLLSHNYLNFGKAIRWMERKFHISIFPVERRKHCNSLRCYGWRGAMWGIRRRVYLHHRNRINDFLQTSSNPQIILCNIFTDRFQKSQSRDECSQPA